jgi:8-oxo-dGTP pyrophosphatase MutT (NUDIX family)
MNFEPQKFFIGLVDFFSILMPGAVLTYIAKDRVAFALLGQQSFHLDRTEAWMLFLFVSYLSGHFLFLLGAVLDEWLYDPLRQCTYWGQVSRLAKEKRLRSRILRSMAGSNWFFGVNADAAVMQAQRIKARALQPLSAQGAINAFQWSKARLSKDHPEGLLEVHRFEADSKFFRSFVVVLAMFALIYWFQYRRLWALIWAGLLVLALWRYMDQRFKATQQAYWFVVTLEGMKELNSQTVRQAHRPDNLTHAGGVVFRKGAKTVEYLLVEASNNRMEWVLPKGHIEAGEEPRETAVREVKEETGQWARVVDWIEDVRFEVGSERLFVRMFLMELMEDTALWTRVKNALFKKPSRKSENWRPEHRQHQWLPLVGARVAASFEETGKLLDRAESKTASLPRR